MPDTEGVRSRLRGVATLAVDMPAISYCGIRLSTRTGPFKAQFPTPIRPNTDDRVVGRGGTAVG